MMRPWVGGPEIPFFKTAPVASGFPLAAKTSKLGDIYVQQCDFNAPLYPADVAPSDWKSCDDAYKFTWTNDFKGELAGLDALSKTKLVNSMGFCPQNRCQLYNVSNGGSDGMCPAGLCYTKVENGGPSFGACCYAPGGLFNSGTLIGYYNKSQPSPKPIYKRSRVVLGQPSRRGGTGGADSTGAAAAAAAAVAAAAPFDESYATFINANEVYPGLIATQCPLAGRPAGYAATVGDVKRMIVENNVAMWVQLAPDGADKYLSLLRGTATGTGTATGAAGGTDQLKYTPGTGSCGVFPLEFFMGTGNTSYLAGVSDFKVVTSLADINKVRCPRPHPRP